MRFGIQSVHRKLYSWQELILIILFIVDVTPKRFAQGSVVPFSQSVGVVMMHDHLFNVNPIFGTYLPNFPLNALLAMTVAGAPHLATILFSNLSAALLMSFPFTAAISTHFVKRSTIINMFVVSGHLYRPLLSSQSWELGGKILGCFGTHPRRFLVPG